MSVNKGAVGQNELSHLTIDIPKKILKRFKVIADLQGKDVPDYINELIAKEIHSKKVANQETLDAIRDAKNGKGLVENCSLQDLFEKLDI